MGKKKKEKPFDCAAGFSEKPKRALIAKKDWRIFCPPEHDIKIKEGQDVSDVPQKFLATLKTEGVI